MPVKKWSDHIAIAKLSGDPQLSDQLIHLSDKVTEDAHDLVLDMTGVRYINSSNLSKFLKLRKLMVGSDRRLILAGMDAQVANTFVVTGLDKIFEFAPTVPGAVKDLEVNVKTNPAQK